jgi:hypothetical protein
MRLILYILAFLFGTISFAQLSLLKGTWINSTNDLILIHDTVSFDNSNYLENKRGNKDFLLYLFGDTLSFQDQYYSSRNNCEKLYIDRYDLKIISCTEKSIVIRPVSDLSQSFFGHETEMTFTKQPFLKDDLIDFEKVIFHTSRCFGTCPIYHLQIDNKRQVKLFAEEVFSNTNEIFAYNDDTAKMGHFEGILSENTYTELVNELKTCNIDSLNFDGSMCCDGTIITIIIYYNGERKYLKSMFPPIMANSLISCLYNICRNTPLARTKSKFKIEK